MHPYAYHKQCTYHKPHFRSRAANCLTLDAQVLNTCHHSYRHGTANYLSESETTYTKKCCAPTLCLSYQSLGRGRMH